MRDGWLQGVQAVIQRQQRVPPEGYNDRLFLDRQNRRLRSFGPVRKSSTEARAFDLATVLGLIPCRLAKTSGSLVSLEGPPLSLWRSRGEPVP